MTRPYVMVDLEATCWENGSRPERMEIVEIGAVRMESADCPATEEFARFVRPVLEDARNIARLARTILPSVDAGADSVRFERADEARNGGE